MGDIENFVYNNHHLKCCIMGYFELKIFVLVSKHQFWQFLFLKYNYNYSYLYLTILYNSLLLNNTVIIAVQE